MFGFEFFVTSSLKRKLEGLNMDTIRGKDDSHILGSGNCMHGICVVLLWI